MTCFFKCRFYIYLALLIFFKKCFNLWYDLSSAYVTNVFTFQKKLLFSFKGTRFPLSGWAQSTCARNYILVQNLGVTLFKRCDHCIPSWGSWAHFPDLQYFHVCLVWCYLPSYARRFPKRSLRLEHLALNCARIDHFAKMRCAGFLYSMLSCFMESLKKEHQVVGLCYVTGFAVT
jgi:hypothetical protein